MSEKIFFTNKAFNKFTIEIMSIGLLIRNLLKYENSENSFSTTEDYQTFIKKIKGNNGNYLCLLKSINENQKSVLLKGIFENCKNFSDVSLKLYSFKKKIEEIEGFVNNSIKERLWKNKKIIVDEEIKKNPYNVNIVKFGIEEYDYDKYGVFFIILYNNEEIEISFNETNDFIFSFFKYCTGYFKFETKFLNEETKNQLKKEFIDLLNNNEYGVC